MKILLVDTNHEILKTGLENLGFQCDEDYISTKESIEKRIHHYDGLVIRSRFSIDRSFLDAAVQLKFIARVGAGLENIDIDYAQLKSIDLISAPEGNRNAVGEHTLGMLLSLLINLNKADREVRQGKWLREQNRGLELDGKTIGLIGYGNMGKAFANKLKGFDVEVLCYDILPHVGDENCKQVPLVEVQEKADILSLHTPETALTHHIIHAEFINAFEKPFWFLNTARGNSVVTKDLVNALKSGKVLGAALDVLEYEKASFENLFIGDELPKAFKDLIESDKVLLTPHIAGWTKESKEKLAQTIIDKVKEKFC
ncbi:MAG: hydroxyacid dehydrogenase [Flavobacteriaceae bacterium]|nr:hydroxyacid dehydrogenase [Flavobacteriaceae bacterium]